MEFHLQGSLEVVKMASLPLGQEVEGWLDQRQEDAEGLCPDLPGREEMEFDL